MPNLERWIFFFFNCPEWHYLFHNLKNITEKHLYKLPPIISLKHSTMYAFIGRTYNCNQKSSNLSWESSSSEAKPDHHGDNSSVLHVMYTSKYIYVYLIKQTSPNCIFHLPVLSKQCFSSTPIKCLWLYLLRSLQCFFLLQLHSSRHNVENVEGPLL